jgi:hypothetical protein
LSYLLKRGRDLEATFLSPTATLLFPAHRSGVNVPGLLLTSPSTASLARSAAISPPGLSRELAGRLYNRNPLPAPSAPPPEVLSIRRSPPGFHPSGSKHPNEPALRRTYLRIRPISLRSPPADFYSNRRIIVPSPLRFLRIADFEGSSLARPPFCCKFTHTARVNHCLARESAAFSSLYARVLTGKQTHQSNRSRPFSIPCCSRIRGSL